MSTECRAETFQSILLLHIRFYYMIGLRRYWLSSHWDICLCTLSLVHRAVSDCKNWDMALVIEVLHCILRYSYDYTYHISLSIHSHCSAYVNKSWWEVTCVDRPIPSHSLRFWSQIDVSSATTVLPNIQWIFLT